ncbi:MAG: helix-hairpin-helix domain-containing protein [Candidatus Hermodarchaeota archaeon]
MKSITYIAQGIGSSTVERMKMHGITSIEKLANSSVETLTKIDGINVADAKKYINIAKRHLENIKTKEKINSLVRERLNKGKQNSNEYSTNQNTQKNQNNKKISIDTLKKLASSKAEEISKTKGIELSSAERYIDIAKKYLENMRIKQGIETSYKEVPVQESLTSEEILVNLKVLNEKSKPMVKGLPKKPVISDLILFSEKPKPAKVKLELPPLKVENILPKKPYFKPKVVEPPTPSVKSESVKVSTSKSIKEKEVDKTPEIKTFFPLETMQSIRFHHFKIKELEKTLQKKEDFLVSEINNIIDYIQLLNINYKTQSQIKIFKELEITPSYYDPIDKKEIRIWDLIFECSRVLWIAALAYSYLSKKYESLNLMENSIVAMVECSKMYKTAAYFSAACTRQEEKGSILTVGNLELNSEEARILAQNLAVISEERKGNYSMAANLSSGLSALTKRLTFLKKYNQIREYQLKAQFNYDIGRACHFKAQACLKESDTPIDGEKIEKLQQKANYYYFKAEELWEYMLNNIETLSIKEKDSLKINLSIVNQDIMENDVATIDNDEAAKIEDPEPLIIIPENLAPFVPRTTNYLEKYKQSDLNFDAYLRYKSLMSEVFVNFNKLDELKNNKAGIGRTIKQLQILYENNDIDINTFSELLEKYNIKLETIQSAIDNLHNPTGAKQVKIKQVQKFKPKK